MTDASFWKRNAHNNDYFLQCYTLCLQVPRYDIVILYFTSLVTGAYRWSVARLVTDKLELQQRKNILLKKDIRN